MLRMFRESTWLVTGRTCALTPACGQAWKVLRDLGQGSACTQGMEAAEAMVGCDSENDHSV